MADSQKDKTQSSPLTEYRKLKRQLEHAVLVDVPANRFVENLMALDAPLEELLPEGTTTLEANPVEVGVAWVPSDVPVTVHLYLDQKPLPGASGTFEGGLLRFPVPPTMYKPGARLVAMLRFFMGGWKYQVWAKAGGVTQKLDEGKDPDPAEPKNDLFVKGYQLP